LPLHGSHGTYNENILLLVKEAFSKYRQINEDALNQNHDSIKPLDVKKRLVKISQQYYKKFIDRVSENINKKTTDDIIKVNDIE
jgi:hypothetical protein